MQQRSNPSIERTRPGKPGRIDAMPHRPVDSGNLRQGAFLDCPQVRSDMRSNRSFDTDTHCYAAAFRFAPLD
jgi:hypothetical protein